MIPAGPSPTEKVSLRHALHLLWRSLGLEEASDTFTLSELGSGFFKGKEKTNRVVALVPCLAPYLHHWGKLSWHLLKSDFVTGKKNNLRTTKKKKKSQSQAVAAWPRRNQARDRALVGCIWITHPKWFPPWQAHKQLSPLPSQASGTCYSDHRGFRFQAKEQGQKVLGEEENMEPRIPLEWQLVGREGGQCQSDECDTYLDTAIRLLV